MFVITSAVIFTAISVSLSLFHIRDHIRNGIVCENVDEYMILLTRSSARNVFRKKINRFVPGNFVYTFSDAGTLYSVVTGEMIDDRFPDQVTVVKREPQVQ